MAAVLPVDVHIPAGPAPAKAPIHLDASDALVTALPWLQWDPAPAAGGVPRVSLDLSVALSAFAIKCSLDRSPAAMAALAPINILTLRLSANAWSRLLTAVRDSGLLARTIAVLDELHAYIRESVPIVIIGAVDWQPAPPLAIGMGNAAARAAATRIRFLGLANIAHLEVTAGALAGSAPWAIIGELSGAFGPVSTEATRRVETSHVQSVGELLRSQSSGGATDAALAFNLRSSVTRATMPKVLRSHGASVAEQSEELADGFAYKQSSADRTAVEQKRIDCLEHW